VIALAPREPVEATAFPRIDVVETAAGMLQCIEEERLTVTVMGKNSRIEWAHHTFNPWWGCTKISEACRHCYAETWSKRVGQNVWGVKAKRRFFGDEHWSEPLHWNKQARELSMRFRVFCASMADVFEDRRDLDVWRDKLWELIAATPRLDWLLLTKRPEVVARLVPWDDAWPQNVWFGTTVEDQDSAVARLSYLSKLPAIVRFISAEPLLGPLDVRPWLGSTIDWVITGGESGPKARPSSPSWFKGLLDQCNETGVAFLFKQWGDWAPGPSKKTTPGRGVEVADGTVMLRIGKKAAGRMLDGALWDGLPEAIAV
jgi:protein gp37